MSNTPETESSSIIAKLREYNLWRRGSEQLAQPDSTEIGLCLDAVCEIAERLERERDEAREALADWENAAEHVKADHSDEVHCGCVAVLRKLLSDALRERDDARKSEMAAILERERWKMRAEEKWAMRRELEELLGVESSSPSDEQFSKGINDT
jgi:hypothetical protein